LSDGVYYVIPEGSCGKCIIINQKFYKEPEYKNRVGTDLDCARLRETFIMLGYDVAVHNNVKMHRMKEILTSERDGIDNSCCALVVCVLAHGGNGN
jgi:hypothetical protein